MYRIKINDPTYIEILTEFYLGNGQRPSAEAQVIDVYFNKDTLDIIWTGTPDVEAPKMNISEEEYLQQIDDFISNDLVKDDNWRRLSSIQNDEWDQVYNSWLEEVGKPENTYYGSLSRGEKQGYYSFQYDYANNKATEFLKDQLS